MTRQHSGEWHELHEASRWRVETAEGDPTGIDAAMASGTFELNSGRLDISFGSIPPVRAETIEEFTLRRVSGRVLATVATEPETGWTAAQIAEFNAEIAPVDAAKSAAEAAIALYH